MRILAIGDIVGSPGRRAFRQLGKDLARVHRADFVVVNAENSAAGFGVTPETAEELFSAGADCLTTGNHVWKHRSIYPYFEQENRILRPANYPDGAPGSGCGIYQTAAGTIAVINLMGRFGGEQLDCPFRAFDRLHEELASSADVVLVDFHAESTSEKVSLGYYAAGRASCVFGTHTHVQTADERILDGKTAFITDIGMTGPEDSVIGVAKEAVIERFLTRMPVRHTVPDGPALLRGILVEVDPRSGHAVGIRRIQERAL